MNALRRMAYAAASMVRPRNAAVILMYHSISNSEHWSAVTPEMFASHMQALNDGGFNVVSLETLATYRKNGTIPEKTVCITFDDGYLDNYTEALPVLRRFNFPATIFVITGTIGSTLTVRSEEFHMMSESQVQELDSSGLVAIEPHTESHRKLHGLSAAEVEEEVATSRKRLESLTGRPKEHFAYPFGRVNQIARGATRKAGIRYAYTIEPGYVRAGDDDLMLRRNAIDRTTTSRELIAIAAAGRISRTRFFNVRP